MGKLRDVALTNIVLVGIGPMYGIEHKTILSPQRSWLIADSFLLPLGRFALLDARRSSMNFTLTATG